MAGASVRPGGCSRLRVDNCEALRDAALGIAWPPAFLVGEDLESGSLREVLSAFEADPVEIVAVHPGRRLLEPRVRRFIDLLTAELSARSF